MRQKKLLAVIVLILVALSPLLLDAAGNSRVALIKEIDGEVFIKKGGGSREFKAFEGLGLVEGDTVRSGKESSATIYFDEGSKSTIGSNTKITITEQGIENEGNQTKVRLWSGKLWNSVENLLNLNDEFEVETSSAIMGVRGTMFLVEADPNSNKTKVSVLEGKVAATASTEPESEIDVDINESFEVRSKEQGKTEVTKLRAANLVKDVEPVLLAAMITDIEQTVEKSKQKITQEKKKFDETDSNTFIKKSLQLAKTVKALRTLQKEFIDEIKKSDKRSDVEKALKEKEKDSLASIEEKNNTALEEAVETEEQIEKTAKKAGVSEEELDEIDEPFSSDEDKGSTNPPKNDEPTDPKPEPELIETELDSEPVTLGTMKIVSFGNNISLNFSQLSNTSNIDVSAKDVTNLLDEESIPSDVELIGNAYNFTVNNGDETAFESPVLMTLPVNTETDKTKIGIFYLDEATNEWYYQPSEVKEQDGKTVVKAETTHFSTFAVFSFSEETEELNHENINVIADYYFKHALQDFIEVNSNTKKIVRIYNDSQKLLSEGLAYDTERTVITAVIKNGFPENRSIHLTLTEPFKSESEAIEVTLDPLPETPLPRDQVILKNGEDYLVFGKKQTHQVIGLYDQDHLPIEKDLGLLEPFNILDDLFLYTDYEFSSINTTNVTELHVTRATIKNMTQEYNIQFVEGPSLSLNIPKIEKENENPVVQVSENLATIDKGQNVTLKSNEPGLVFLVKKRETEVTLEQLLIATLPINEQLESNGNLGIVKREMVSASISTVNLLPGIYEAYSVDQNMNISNPVELSVVDPTAVSTASIILDKEQYKINNSITVQVNDQDENANSEAQDALTIHVHSTESDLEGFDLQLYETGISTGLFEGRFSLSNRTILSDRVLAVSAGEQVVITYVDQENDTGIPVTLETFTEIINSTPNVTGFENGTLTRHVSESISSKELSEYVYDPDGDPLTFTNFVSQDEKIAKISVEEDGTLLINGLSVGSTTISGEVSDGKSEPVSFNIDVEFTNAPPIAIAISERMLDSDHLSMSVNELFEDQDENSHLEFVSANSSDENVATITLSEDKKQMTITRIESGSTDITVAATDGYSEPVSNTFTVSILPSTIMLSGTASLTEDSLVGALLEIELISDQFIDSLTKEQVQLNNMPDGVTIAKLNQTDNQHVDLTLAFDGTDFDQSVEIASITIQAEALTESNQPVTSQPFSIEAVNESIQYTKTTLTESDLDDGSITEKLEIILYGDNFNGEVGTDLPAESITFTNVPAGLTAKASILAKNKLEVSFEGEASSHLNKDDVVVTIALLDNAFQNKTINHFENTAHDLTIDFNEDMKGSGTAEDPYVLTAPDHLDLMRQTLSAHYELGNDLDLSAWGNWNPVGSYSSPFTGTFNGNDFTIFNLVIDSRSTRSGLFGETEKATIKNVHLTNVNITGRNRTGSLIGYMHYGLVENATANGVVTSSGEKVGGLIGMSSIGDIKKSSFKGDVVGATAVGGLVGYNYGQVRNTFANGSVTGTENVGGLIGEQPGSTYSSYFTGTVSGTTNVGGLVGINEDVFSGRVNNSFYNSDTTGLSETGKGTPKTTSELKTAQTFLNARWDTNIWLLEDGSYPTFLRTKNDAPNVEALNGKEISLHYRLSLPSSTLSPLVVDPEGDELTFLNFVSQDDSIATITEENGSFTVKAASVGTTTITGEVSDGNNEPVPFSFTIQFTNAEPIPLDIAPYELLTGFESVTIPVTDLFTDEAIDLDYLTIESASSSDQGVETVNISTDQKRLTVTEVGIGSTTVTVKATDGYNDPVTNTFNVSVEDTTADATVSGSINLPPSYTLESELQIKVFAFPEGEHRLNDVPSTNVILPVTQGSIPFSIPVQLEQSYTLMYEIINRTNERIVERGYFSESGTVTHSHDATEIAVHDSISSLTLTLLEGNIISGTLTLDTPVPDNGLPIMLIGDNHNHFIDKYLIIPAGTQTYDYTLTVPKDSEYYLSYQIIDSEYTKNNYVKQAYYNKWGTHNPTRSYASRIDLTSNDQTGIDIQILDGVAVSGTITLPKPAPLGGMAIRITDDDHEYFSNVYLEDGETSHDYSIVVPVKDYETKYSIAYSIMTPRDDYNEQYIREGYLTSDGGITTSPNNGNLYKVVIKDTPATGVNLTVIEGNVISGTVNISTPAEVGGEWISLSSILFNKDAQATEEVFVPLHVAEGATSVPFTLVVLPNEPDNDYMLLFSRENGQYHERFGSFVDVSTGNQTGIHLSDNSILPNLTVTKETNTSFLSSWEPVIANSSLEINYYVELFNVSENVNETNYITAANSQQFDYYDDIKPGTDYLLSVTALACPNSNFCSPDDSDAQYYILQKSTINVTTDKMPEVSMAYGKEVTDQSISLNWDPVNNATIYQVYVDGVKVKEQATEDVTLTKLTPNTIYNIEIKALDSNQKVIANTTIVQRTFDSIPNLTTSDISSTSLTIRWDDYFSSVDTSFSEDEYLSYSIYVNGSYNGYIEYDGSLGYSHAIANLEPNTDYEIKLEARGNQTYAVSKVSTKTLSE